jgi:exopolyphosphatase/guanosine-5'-triphosphate,3'-diphosphate pyrophosphatase
MPRYAAIDIGSNSVRMMVAETALDGIRILAQGRQVTRLGESVFRSGNVSAEALDFLCGTLRRMAEEYRKFDIAGLRAVATSAVRDTGNRQEFINGVSAAIGAPVEVISGQEEARLIHLGVNARWPRPKERTLIIDVGGGSAELIASQNGELLDATSRPLGAVRLKEVFLPSDPPAPDELQRLDQYIDEKLAVFVRRHQDTRFDRAIATSSTGAALICALNRLPRSQRDKADRLNAGTNDIKRFYKLLVKESLEERRQWVGIGPRRAEIIVGGAAVFLRTLQALHHPSLYYSAAGVRDGIIADLAARGVGRELASLSREQRVVVEAMTKRYGTPLQHARTVARLARRLFEITQSIHRLPPAAGKVLEAAAYLHDIGHFVSSTGHHKHSAYLVANSDLPGFQAQERMAIAGLCRFHRKALPQPRHSALQTLPQEWRRTVTYLAPLLRIADSLDRSHEQKVRNVQLSVKNGSVVFLIEADEDPSLEIWAAGEAAAAFTQVYGLHVAVRRERQ